MRLARLGTAGVHEDTEFSCPVPVPINDAELTIGERTREGAADEVIEQKAAPAGGWIGDARRTKGLCARKARVCKLQPGFSEHLICLENFAAIIGGNLEAPRQDSGTSPPQRKFEGELAFRDALRTCVHRRNDEIAVRHCEKARLGLGA